MENTEDGARFSPRRNKTNGGFCCVYGCSSRADNDYTLRFHHFPTYGNSNLKKHRDVHEEQQKYTRFKAWLSNLKMSGNYLHSSTVVCSLHFKREDYILPDVPYIKKLLRNTAVPTCNLPTAEQSYEAERAMEAAEHRRQERRQQIEERRKGKELEMLNDQEMTIKQESGDPMSIDIQFQTIDEFPPAKKKKYAKKKKKSADDAPVDPLMQTGETGGLGKEKKTKKKGKTIKKNSNMQDYLEVVVKEEHEEMIPNENCLPIIEKTFVSIGIQAEAAEANDKGVYTEKNVVSIGIQAEARDLKLKLSDLLTTDKELSTMTGIPNFEILRRVVEAVKMVYPEKMIRANLDTRDKVIMTLTKLKHDMSYAVLSSLFKCARIAQCRNMVYNTLTKLSNVLKHAIQFPTMEEISMDPPDCFEGFRDVRVVLDRIEIAVQRPINLCCQLALFSHCKNYTVKFMMGFTPAGLISFVSKAYSGRALDESIFEQSKIVEQLSKNEAIMTSKDFAVESICSEHGVKLIRPMLDTDETFKNDKIAKALVHIEKAHQRLKMFKVLSSTVPISLIKKCEDILIVAAAIVNISSQYCFR